MGCTVHGVAKSRTQLSDFHFQFHLGFIHNICLSAIKTSRFKALKNKNHNVNVEKNMKEIIKHICC